jgi:quinolinate synthase
MTTLALPSLGGVRPFADYAALSAQTIRGRLGVARRALGTRVVILGHHYQRESVIEFADFRGDSLKLSQLAAEQTEAEFIVFCGVHFMAESADILSRSGQVTILPDLNAGCSMADMASTEDVLLAGATLDRLGIETVPVTYMNSTAALKAFCGERGGIVCTSSNAAKTFTWAFERGPRIFFFPDEHLGRNTGVKLGVPLSEMVVWDPARESGGLTPDQLKGARVILWKGCCSVHTKFQVRHVNERRAEDPGVRVLVHPEVPHEVVQAADDVGSTDHIIRVLETAPAGSRWAVGTEYHLVSRLARLHRRGLGVAAGRGGAGHAHEPLPAA